MAPEVTVLMCVYNGGSYLSLAIRSILNQTFTNFEFIIIDDYSDDNTAVIISEFKDARIKYIKNHSNIGLTKSLIRGITIAKGRYIARMDSDDISLPNRLQRQLEFLKTNPGISLIGSSAVTIDHNGMEIGKIDVFLENDQIKAQLFFMNAFVHTSIMGEISLFNQINYSSEIVYAQDYYLWSQLAKEFRFANIEEALVKYRIHEQNISIAKRVHQDFYVKKTYAFHLNQLEINSNNEEGYELHFQILNKELDPFTISWRENFEILKWLILLKNKNQKLKIYDQVFFNANLTEYWNMYFRFSYRHGLLVIPFIFNSFNIQMKLKLRIWFIYKSIRCEIYKWFHLKKY